MTYVQRLRALLSPGERRVFQKLSTPQKIQDLLDHFPANVLTSREHTMRSPRMVLKKKKAHCVEGAMLAAAALAYHGRPPLLMYLESSNDDYDHVVALFKEDGRWGAISKTNYPVLRWRDPVYKNFHELAMSFFHEYVLDNGKKTMRAYSAPFNVRSYDPASWITAQGNVDWLPEALGATRHFPVAPPKRMRALRRASPIETSSTAVREWTKKGKRLF